MCPCLGNKELRAVLMVQESDSALLPLYVAISNHSLKGDGTKDSSLEEPCNGTSYRSKIWPFPAPVTTFVI